MSQFVSTNDDGTEGLLFTNFETSPGMITRMPISQDDDGEWQADLANTINLANTEEFRDVGGTRINCYGDLSPWNTAISSEEEYNHTRLSLTATTSEVLEADSAVGLRGAAQFFNRPNPATVGETEWYEQYNDGVYPRTRLGSTPSNCTPTTSVPTRSIKWMARTPRHRSARGIRINTEPATTSIFANPSPKPHSRSNTT